MTQAELRELGTQRSCQQVLDFLLAYLDGELPASEQAIFDAHLAICAACRNYLDSYQATLRLVKSSHDDQSAASLPQLPEELVQAILAARENT
ncbi:MAG: zf-HC2 domain-containing protein [Pirellulales bacterium]|nr:zf-HC2 domain-containing protein [Pirellulales bacterium]